LRAATGSLGGLDQALGGATASFGMFIKAAASAAVLLKVGGFLWRGIGATVRAAMDLETALIEVTKVTGWSTETTDEFGRSLTRMAAELPRTAKGLAVIAEMGARLAIQGREALEGFTEAVAKSSVALKLQDAVAAEALARIAKFFPETLKGAEGFERLGSALVVASKNVSATTGAVVEGTKSVAGYAGIIGLTIGETVALSGVLAELSLTGKRAGSTLFRWFTRAAGSIEAFADEAKVDFDVFAKALRTDPVRALLIFASAFKGLPLVETIERLKALNLRFPTLVRLVSGLAGRIELTADVIHKVNAGFEANVAMQKELEKASKATGFQIGVLRDNITGVFAIIGRPLNRAIGVFITNLNRLLSPLLEMPEWLAKSIGLIAILAASSVTLAGVILGVKVAFAFLGVALLAGAFLLNVIHEPAILRLAKFGLLKSKLVRSAMRTDTIKKLLKNKQRIWAFIETPIFLFDYEK